MRALYHYGHTNAAMVLASIVYSGFKEHRACNPLSTLDFGLNLHLRFFTSPEEKKSILRNLEEYREITQNPCYFKHKIVRDLLLLKFFEAKDDMEMVNAQLKQLDLNQAIWLDNRFCADHTILSCIKLNEHGLQQLVSNKQVFHHLLSLGRILLANTIKQKIPEEILKMKDDENRNILHILIDYFSIHGIRSSFFIVEMFNFVCLRFPEMLAEMNNKGKIVYDEIEQLKLHRHELLRDTIEKIELTIALCQEERPSNSAGMKLS